jgi:hypothetical protein
VAPVSPDVYRESKADRSIVALEPSASKAVVETIAPDERGKRLPRPPFTDETRSLRPTAPSDDEEHSSRIVGVTFA